MLLSAGIMSIATLLVGGLCANKKIVEKYGLFVLLFQAALILASMILCFVAKQTLFGILLAISLFVDWLSFVKGISVNESEMASYFLSAASTITNLVVGILLVIAAF